MTNQFIFELYVIVYWNIIKLKQLSNCYFRNFKCCY